MPTGFTNFPGSLDTHTGASPFGFGIVNNGAYTKLTADLSASATTVTVADTSAFPSQGGFVIGREVCAYYGKTGTTFTSVFRGLDGTTAAAHAKGATVGQAPVAANHNDLAAAIVALETYVGIPGAGFGMKRLGLAVASPSPVASVTFSGIPTIYPALLLTGLARSAYTGAATDIIYIRVNADSSAIYDNQYLFFAGTSASASEGIANTESLISYCSSATTPAGASTSFSLTMPGYAGGVLPKSWTSQWRYTAAFASGNVSGGMFTTGWRSTATITSITIGLVTGSDFVVGSEFALYGLP